MQECEIQAKRSLAIIKNLYTCEVVDKDAVSESIGDAIMAMQELYKLTGVSRRARKPQLEILERKLTALKPIDQAQAAEETLNSARRAHACVKEKFS